MDTLIEPQVRGVNVNLSGERIMSAPTNPRLELLKLTTGYWISQAINAAAKLGVADHIEAGVRDPKILAHKTQTQPHALYRLLRALASIGIFKEDAAGHFDHTPMSELLVDRLGSMRAPSLLNGDEHYASWGDLVYSVQTGQPAFDRIYGKPIFPWLAEHPEQAKIFDAAMTGIHGPETQAMVDAYDFTGIQRLVDIGGGNGTLLCAILQKQPALQGILYDLPGVIERSKVRIAEQGLADRCECVAGSFFESVAPGGDAYLMRHIIHDWNDEQCHTILSHCRRAMQPGNKLLIIECVIEPGNAPGWSKFLDLNMLVLPGGMERTEAEFRTLLTKAGFELKRIVPTRTEVSVLESVAR